MILARFWRAGKIEVRDMILLENGAKFFGGVLPLTKPVQELDFVSFGLAILLPQGER